MAYNPYTGRWEMDGAQQVQLQPMPRPQIQQMQPQPPKIGVLTVASEASINNLQMQPNDNALALHEYYIRTDSMAAKTIARFRIFPEPTEEEKAANQLQEQLKQITAGLQNMAGKIEELEGRLNAKSDYGPDGRKRRGKQAAERPDADGEDNAAGAEPADGA